MHPIFDMLAPILTQEWFQGPGNKNYFLLFWGFQQGAYNLQNYENDETYTLLQPDSFYRYCDHVIINLFNWFPVILIIIKYKSSVKLENSIASYSWFIKNHKFQWPSEIWNCESLVSPSIPPKTPKNFYWCFQGV